MVGSSVGSLIGAFWASGYSASEIDELSKQGGPFTVFDFSLFADRGWIRGQRLQDFVNDRLNSQRIELMPRKFIAAATRLNDKQPVFLQSGNAGRRQSLQCSEPNHLACGHPRSGIRGR